MIDAAAIRTQIKWRLRQKPFQPFFLILDDGEVVLVKDREFITVPRGAAGNRQFSALARDCSTVFNVKFAAVKHMASLNVVEATRYADSILPGTPTRKGIDPRWQAIILVGEFIETDPEPIWQFINKWGRHRQRDLRDAIGTCLLEHLLEHHFAAYFPRVEEAARKSAYFGDTFLGCWKFGQSEARGNSQRYNRLVREIERNREQRKSRR